MERRTFLATLPAVGALGGCSALPGGGGGSQTYSVGESAAFKDVQFTVEEFRVRETVTLSEGGQRQSGSDEAILLVKVSANNGNENRQPLPAVRNGTIRLEYGEEFAGNLMAGQGFRLDGRNRTNYNAKVTSSGMHEATFPGKGATGWVGFTVPSAFTPARARLHVTLSTSQSSRTVTWVLG